jgi:hypothetical protein
MVSAFFQASVNCFLDGPPSRWTRREHAFGLEGPGFKGHGPGQDRSPPHETDRWLAQPRARPERAQSKITGFAHLVRSSRTARCGKRVADVLTFFPGASPGGLTDDPTEVR